MWVLKIQVMPEVVGALGNILKKAKKDLNVIGVNSSIGLIQKLTLLGIAKFIRKVLEL